MAIHVNSKGDHIKGKGKMTKEPELPESLHRLNISDTEEGSRISKLSLKGEEQIGENKCPDCGSNKRKLFHGDDDKWIISCSNCGRTFGHGKELSRRGIYGINE